MFKRASRLALGCVLLLLLSIATWYAVSFLPHLATMKASSARGMAAAGDVRPWQTALDGTHETPQSMRAWAVRQSYAAANPQAGRSGMGALHANNLLWYGASYLHFDADAMFGIWIDCAVEGCGQGLPAAARRYLGKELAAVSPREIASLVKYVCSPARNIPVRDPVTLTLRDRQEIAAAVMHDISLPAESMGRPFTITLAIAGDDTADLKRYVMHSYPAGQRFIDEPDRIEKDHCWYDRRTALPALGIGVDVIKPRNDGTAVVTAGSAQCMMGMQQSTYVLQRVDGHWKVVSTHVDAII